MSALDGVLDVLGGFLVAIGVVLMVLAAVGVLRLPDVFIRASASTKAAGLGVALILAGVALLAPSANAAVKLFAAILLQFATAPIAGHVIGRAAYRSGAPLWRGTDHDELGRATPPPPTPRAPAPPSA